METMQVMNKLKTPLDVARLDVAYRVMRQRQAWLAFLARRAQRAREARR